MKEQPKKGVNIAAADKLFIDIFGLTRKLNGTDKNPKWEKLKTNIEDSCI